MLITQGKIVSDSLLGVYIITSKTGKMQYCDSKLK